MVASSARRFRLALLVALLALLVRAVPSYAKCDPTTDPDKSDIATARAEVAANCPCTGPTVTHGAYVRCAAQQANASLANPSCARAVEKCAAKSTCGKPDAVTCCVTRTGSTKCKIKRDAAHCTGPNGSTACVGPYTSCCDACTSSGCATTTTSATTTTTSSTLNCVLTGGNCKAPFGTLPCCDTDTTCIVVDPVEGVCYRATCTQPSDCAPPSMCLAGVCCFPSGTFCGDGAPCCAGCNASSGVCN